MRRFVGVWLWVSSCMALAGLCAPHTRADAMSLTLGRLSQGECAQTLSSASDFALSADGAPVLTPDRATYAELAAQIAGALAPSLLAPVTTRGPRGFDVGFDTGITTLDRRADAWERGTRGKRTPLTCEGRNRDVSRALTSNRVRFVKGLPLGISLGANVGFVQGLGLWTFGSELKVALIESSARRWVPDLALRLASNTLVGDAALSLSAFSFDVIASREFPSAHVMQWVPYAALGAVLSRAATAPVDLTPNVDAAACVAGRDAVCNAQGLGASSADLAHDARFPTLRMMRYRALLGLWLRYRFVAFAAEASVDLVQPGTADRDVPARTARQWSFQLAPSLSF